tara:strand:- start:1161 stop:1358 length:198 start_codon:yes stop_codon:yes gene_type:complete
MASNTNKKFDINSKPFNPYDFSSFIVEDKLNKKNNETNNNEFQCVYDCNKDIESGETIYFSNDNK